MNQFFDVAVNQLLEGELDLLVDPVSVAAYQYVNFQPDFLTVADLLYEADPVTTPAVPLAGRFVDGRRLRADPVTFAELPEYERLTALILYRADTNGLIAMIDQRPDLAPLHVSGNGGPVEVRWSGPLGNEVISL